MIETFQIKKIVKQSDSPFILTFNEDKHLIGDKGRALEGYVQKGMNIQASGFYRGNDFLIEDLTFLDGVVTGGQLNIYL
jgi:hypothetical protein